MIFSDADKDKNNLHIIASPLCNNNCIFCNESNRDERKRVNVQYTPDVVKSILEQCCGKVNKVIFTSGEPTLNPNLFELVAMAKHMGYDNLSIITNGRRLSYENYSEKLIQNGITEIIISIHGHTAALHDSLTRTKGSFEETVKGMENISLLSSRSRVKLVLASTLNKRNAPFFGEMIDFFYKFNFHEIVFNVVQPLQSNMEKYFDTIMPRYSELAKIIEDYFSHYKDRFFRRTGDGNSRRVISIIDLPFCQSKMVLEYLGPGENRLIHIIDKAQAPEFKIAPLHNARLFSDNQGMKVKRAECGTCICNRVCNGIYTNYIEKFGWDEFLPLVDV